MTTDDRDTDTLQDEIQEALNRILGGKRGAAFVTNWVVLAATVEDDGSQATWALAAKEQRGWQTYGLLQYGLKDEFAEHVARVIGDES